MQIQLNWNHSIPIYRDFSMVFLITAARRKQQLTQKKIIFCIQVVKAWDFILKT
jgi:hypothetical protein